MYPYKTQPLSHQRDCFERTSDIPAWGLFWEQGCGKTKPIIDTAANLYLKGKISGMMIVAPNGVHRNWINDEIPKHLPEIVAQEATIFHYDTRRMPPPKAKLDSQFSGPQREYVEYCRWLIREAGGFIIVAMSYDAVMTKRGQSFIHEFLTKRKVLLVADESHYVKTPGAKRTKRLVAYAKHAEYRRILTGTPMEKPFDVYSQLRFLDPKFWHPLGLGSMAAFRQYFGIWRTAKEVLAEEGYDPGYDQLLGYRNLDQLRERLTQLTHRVTKDDAGLDLPPILFSKLYFEMTSPQRRAYEHLRDEFFVEFEDGTFIEADVVIARMVKLQQITCGYVYVEGNQPYHLIGTKNARLDYSVEFLKNLPHKAIIWTRFKQDVNQLMDALGDAAVRYDGSVSPDDAEKAKNDFQKGDAQFFVGNPRKGGTGLTLHAAKTMLCYSNYFDLILREQAIARAHRIGMDGYPLNVVDVIAPGTIDVSIVQALKTKLEAVSEVIGDKMHTTDFKQWLAPEVA